MPKYIRLTSLTRKGQEQIHESTERTNQMREMAEENGGTIEDVFLTFGEFDFVTIAEFPDDKSYAEFALKASKGGEYGAKTLKAIEEEDYVSIIEKL
ncbi:GYD domain-containing protein [Halodesulfurarchaeum sp.]|uniref:GYD domain-containing protein n=1 Tax=Halodesulfurarchaeum sp. TaxID=1980530 RepID=UPI002FC3DA26